MKTLLLVIVLLFCSVQKFYSQEDGVVSLALPIRNSLTYNQYVVNPAFSFVRQQHKYISITNKREWVQFDDAPLTYLVSYSGRFRENIGIGVGLFQQNYGVLTTFGGIVNFAYNVQVNRDSNLTFGINVGAYKSGVNSGKVVSNLPDPSLDNIPSNFLLSVSPGINYGLAFIDFGLSINNLLLYNFNSSELIKDNNEQSIQAHIMYTGYMYNNGFLDESKFSGIIKSEFKEDKTILSGTVMLTIPKGIWAQAGYNSLYGAFGGFGINITKQISVEYNYEKAMGNLSNFGSSHEITLAYKLTNKEKYDYSQEDDVSSLITTKKKTTQATKTPNTKAEENRAASNLAKSEAEEKAKLAAEAKTIADAEEQARLAAETKAIADAEEQARLATEAKAIADAEEQTRLATEAKAITDAEEQARLATEAKAIADAEEQARLATEAKAIADAEEQARITAEAKAIADAEEQARLVAEAKAIADAEEQTRLAAEAKVIADAEEQARLVAEAKVIADAEEQARLATEAKAIADAEEQARLDAEAKAKENVIPNATDKIGISMNALAKSTEDSKNTQAELLSRLSEAVASKDKDLKDLKEENDLSEKGIYMEPKPFKSITAENKALEDLITDLDNVIESRNKKIKELEALYDQRQEIETDTIVMDEIYLYYKKTIKTLKSEQQAAIKTKADFEKRLKEIKIATDYERKRRIKQAVYSNEEDRYAEDKAVLKRIKQNTTLSTVPLLVEDFDFGEARSSNIQILKNVQNVENGYYLIIALHNDVAKRDEFLTKMVAAGEKNIDFFYDVNTSKYYIYYKKTDNIQAANKALELKGSKPYNGKLSIVKIEN